jgi:hypothetical protein
MTAAALARALEINLDALARALVRHHTGRTNL